MTFARDRAIAVIADSVWTMANHALLGLGANIALLLGSYWIARHGFKQPRGGQAILATALIFWVAATLGLEVLGSARALALAPMLAWALFVCAIGGAVRWYRGHADLERATDMGAASVSWEAIVSLALVLSAAVGLGMRSLLLGVKVVSDGPIYHLYFAARWWKAGRLFLVASPFGENAATYFPANGDLWLTWLMATWGGDRLAKVGQAPFLVVAALAAYACARRLGAGRSASVVATCWFASSSPLLLFSFEPNVDTIFVAGYLMAAYFFLRASTGEGDTASYCLGALAAGAALGTKSVGVVFVPPLLCLALVAIMVQRVGARTRLIRTALILGVPVVSGGFWYIRNALLTANPLYPLEVRMLGRTVLPGWYLTDAMRTSPYYLPATEWRALGDIMLGVLDPRLAPFWIASLFAGWMIGNAKSEGAKRLIAIFSFMAVLNVVLYWVCIPYRTQQRFMLQALGLAVVPLAITLDRSRWLMRGAVVLLALHILTPQGWPFAGPDGSIPWDLTPLIPNAMPDPVSMSSRMGTALRPDENMRSVWPLARLLGTVIFALATVWAWTWIFGDSRRSRPRAKLVVALGSSALLLMVGTIDAVPVGLDSRLTFYPGFPDFIRGWLALESRSGVAGARVAYTGTNIPYYLLGQGLRNDVRYINIDRHRDWLLHDYHREALTRGNGTWPNSRPGWDRIQPDYQAWVDNLDAAGIQLVVITRTNPREGAHNAADSNNFPIERQWADAHPERFEPIYGQRERDPWFRLYRFQRSISPSS
jgi:Dolichyl-phosphate-mannose-protein mannosyltransferase